MFWGSNTGNQEEAARFLKDFMEAEGIEIDEYNIADTDPKKMLEYKRLIIGCPTWHIGELQDDWNFIYEKYKVQEYDLRNKLDFKNMGFSNFINLNQNTILDFDKKNNEYKDIFISFNDKTENIIFAKKGNIFNENNQFKFQLSNGFKISLDSNKQIEKLEFNIILKT